jgi:chorismate dehydratase
MFKASERKEGFTTKLRGRRKKIVCYTESKSRVCRKVRKLRISVVQYLNTVPLVRGFTHGPLTGKYDLSFTVPSQCAEALRSGAADLAIIPAIEYQRIPDLVVLPDLAIASRERVRSLLIIAKRPIREVHSMALDRSSRSTQALTRILASRYWKIAPEFLEAGPDLREMLAMGDAAMIIGDPALRISVAVEKNSAVGPDGRAVCHAETLGLIGPEILHVYDVVAEWRRFTSLPAVMAIWAGRRDVVTAEIAADFGASRDYGLLSIGDISAEAARELELPVEELESYLRHNIDFHLGDENCRGLERYFQEAADLGLIPRARKIEWAATASEAAHARAK